MIKFNHLHCYWVWGGFAVQSIPFLPFALEAELHGCTILMTCCYSVAGVVLESSCKSEGSVELVVLLKHTCTVGCRGLLGFHLTISL